MSQPGQPLYGVEHINGGLITFGGGILIKDADGTVIGAIGVSGSAVDNIDSSTIAEHVSET